MTSEISKDGFQRYRAPTPFRKKRTGSVFFFWVNVDDRKVNEIVIFHFPYFEIQKMQSVVILME